MGQCGKKDNKSNYNEMNSHHQKKNFYKKTFFINEDHSV